MEFAIVDVETTGGYGGLNKITEIAIVVHNGVKEIEQFSSLVNPESYIPSPITSLTGITNDMVEDAPKFYEIAKKVWEMTEGRVFVAHNVGFDYKVLQNEFKTLGADFKRKKICTVRLSRKVFKGLPSYSLGNLCESLSIPLNNRHRALGDTLATTLLFEKIISKDGLEAFEKQVRAENKETKLPSNLKSSVFDNLPEETGVYYFYNEKKDVIYVGKAKNIKSRVNSHFLNVDSSARKQNMFREINYVDYEKTGSELVALLLESDEIKKLSPKYNRAQRKTIRNVGLLIYEDQNGYKRVGVDRNSKLKGDELVKFSNVQEARSFLFKILKDYQLCQKLLGLEQGSGACFDFKIHNCKGACVKSEHPADYNSRLEEALTSNNFEKNSFILKDKGRDAEELSMIVVLNGAYLGYGYFSKDQNFTTEFIIDNIAKKQDNKDVQKIIKSFIPKLESIYLD